MSTLTREQLKCLFDSAKAVTDYSELRRCSPKTYVYTVGRNKQDLISKWLARKYSYTEDDLDYKYERSGTHHYEQPIKPVNEELVAGDTRMLDDFLRGFDINVEV